LLTGEDLISARSFPAVFPAMLKEAGYSTALVSCQGSWQNRDVVGSHLFLSCGSRQFLQGGHAAGTLPDGIALPVVEKSLREMSGDVALFVHLYGCHNPAIRRVPRDFTRNWPDPDPATSAKARRKLDSYDTAVAYDDQIVASIIRMAAGRGVPACVFFVSDHGESPSSAIWRDARSRDTFEVPMLVWLSPEYRAAYPDTAARVSAASGRRLRMDQLLEGMLELARVEGYRPWDSPGNFLAAGFDETDAAKGKEPNR
jgi:heptose-I-phosphate ethanolaminephosphotransferase